MRQKTQYPAEEGIGKLHGQYREKSPEKGISQADISANVPFNGRIIPELFPENLFHENANGVFQTGGNQHAAQKQKERPFQ